MTESENNDKEIENIIDIDNLELQEVQGTFHINTLLSNDKQKQIAKTQLDLKSGQDIHKTSFLNQVLNRKNIIYYGKIVHETPIRIDQCNGHIRIRLINQEQITKHLQKIPLEKRTKIGYIHLSTIQILLKSTFLQGIDSPIRMAIIDERMQNLNDQIIGVMNGNLAYQKIKFNTRLKIGIPLQSENLEDAITIAYKFYRNDLMVSGQYPFSITYQISYALTNSHHSIEFKNTDRIYIDQLFNDVAKVGTNFRTNLRPLPAIQFPFQPIPLLHPRHSFSNSSASTSTSVIDRSQSLKIEQPLKLFSSEEEKEKEPLKITDPIISTSSFIDNSMKLDDIKSQIKDLATYIKHTL